MSSLEEEIEDDPSRIEREYLSLRTQLYSSITFQIDRTRSSLHALNNSTSIVSSVRNTIGRITESCSQADKIFDNFPFIKAVSMASENFRDCRKVYEQFKGLNDKVTQANDLLEDIIGKPVLEVSPTALLFLYFELNKLEEFRGETMKLAEGSPQSLQFTLKRYFKRLDDLSAAFASYFWALDIEGLVENPGIVVSIIKIVTKMPDVNAKTKLLDKLDKSVMERFNEINVDDPSDALDSMEFYENAILDVRNRYVACFPPDWHIMDFYLNVYHRGICKVLSAIAIGPIDATGLSPTKDKGKSKTQPSTSTFTRLNSAQLLHVMRWIKHYGEFLSQFAITLDSLSPKILDGKQDNLISDYVKQSGEMIGVWVENLRDAEEKNFRERLQLPEADADNHYFTPAAIDLFQIVKQHVSAAIEASPGRLSLEIIRECCRNVLGFQKAVIKMLQTERDKFLAKPTSCAKYFEDYVIMMGNSCLRWIEYLAELSAKVSGEMIAEYVPSAVQLLKECNQGFLDVAKVTLSILTDVMFESIKSVCPQLFTVDWYTDPGALVSTITATFDDFFHDYREKSEEFLFAKLVADVLERFMLLYLDMLRSKGIKFKQDSIAICFAADVEQLSSFFTQYRDASKVEKALDPLLRITSIIATSNKIIFLEFFAMYQMYNDISLSYVEDILMRRDDLEKSEVKQVIESIKKKIKEEKLGTNEMQTLFSKLPSKKNY